MSYELTYKVLVAARKIIELYAPHMAHHPVYGFSPILKIYQDQNPKVKYSYWYQEDLNSNCGGYIP